MLFRALIVNVIGPAAVIVLLREKVPPAEVMVDWSDSALHNSTVQPESGVPSVLNKVPLNVTTIFTLTEADGLLVI